MPKKKETTEEPQIELDPFVKNPQWDLFCRYYTQNEELFGNATHSYAEAYDYKLDELSHDDGVYEQIYKESTDEYINGKCLEESSYSKAINVCGVEGARLLRNPKIQTRITKLLNEMATEEFVDSQLVKVITQDRDYGPKVSAIKAFNELKGRVVKKSELTGANGGPIIIDDNSRSKTKSALGRFLSGNRKDS